MTAMRAWVYLRCRLPREPCALIAAHAFRVCHTYRAVHVERVRSGRAHFFCSAACYACI